MAKTTPATLILKRSGIVFALHEYAYNPEADQRGVQAAEALNLPPDCVLKTLMTEIDGKPYCVIIPSDKQISMKKLAHAVQGKTAKMMSIPAAERSTGYHVGGISPFGQKRAVPTLLAQEALYHPTIYINAGHRGLLASLSPQDALTILQAQTADLLG
ncbi:Cys-tRNA(Pro) deacylase [Entomobacter blattae]|nr:Cys-tRNA(Pro) deacylase [Entomobacter blattae]